MQFQIETVDQWQEDARELCVQHWKELGLDQDLKVAPNFEQMRVMEKLGMWVVIGARHEGKLVGYLLAVIHAHLHYCTSPKMFIVDAYYLMPEFRNGSGAKLLKFAEAEAKKRGAIKLYLSCKVHQDHSELFKALGYKLSDYAFIKRV